MLDQPHGARHILRSSSNTSGALHDTRISYKQKGNISHSTIWDWKIKWRRTKIISNRIVYRNNKFVINQSDDRVCCTQNGGNTRTSVILNTRLQAVPLFPPLIVSRGERREKTFYLSPRSPRILRFRARNTINGGKSGIAFSLSRHTILEEGCGIYLHIRQTDLWLTESELLI